MANNALQKDKGGKGAATTGGKPQKAERLKGLFTGGVVSSPKTPQDDTPRSALEDEEETDSNVSPEDGLNGLYEESEASDGESEEDGDDGEGQGASDDSAEDNAEGESREEGGGGDETSAGSRGSSLSQLPDELRTLIESDSKDFLPLLRDFKDKVGEMRNRWTPLLESIKRGEFRTSNGVSLLEVKVHSLLSYVTNLGFYLMLKLHGQPISGHAVIDQLVELRIVLEKIKPLEQKLKYQIDKLVKAAATDVERAEEAGGDNASAIAAQDPLKFKPNPMAMATKPDEEVQSSTAAEASTGLYRPPKLAPKPYVDPSTRQKTGRLTDRMKEVASRSRMLHDLRAQFDDRPEEMTAEGTGYGVHEAGASKEDQKWAERERFEEDNFMRLSMTREDKKLQKRLQKQGGLLRFQNEFDSLDADFQDLRGVNRAVEDEDELNFGGEAQARRARSTQKLFGKGPGGNKRKFGDAAEMISALGRSEQSRRGKDEFGRAVKKMRRKARK
ncbi:hypothetical protein HK104_001429 [Borealophlyctis nickersoniae]|nr:hypothetical protein HK104_001429 [Borealophlyctis nickersoniae]